MLGEVRQEKTSSEGLVDIYTITYSNGTITSFTVTNGTDGTQGIQGLPGQDGHTPVITIGTNGNWYVDGIDTNIKAQGEKGEPGQNGKSAYEIYCEAHPEYKKSEAEWLDDLVNGRLATEEKFMVSFNPNNGTTIASQEIIDAFYKLRAPFNVTNLSLKAAFAALSDEEFISKTLKNNFLQMKLYEEFAKENGISYIESYTNFITYFFDKKNSTDLSEKLLKKGIIIRNLQSYGLNAVRISIGIEYENSRFFEEFLQIF